MRTFTPEHLEKMQLENEAQLRVLYEMRCWMRQAIRERENTKQEIHRAGVGNEKLIGKGARV